MKVRLRKDISTKFEEAISKLNEQPVIKYTNKKPDLTSMKWFIIGKVNDIDVLLFFNHKESKLVADLNSPIRRCVANLTATDYREVILDEQTKQTHTKDSRQRLQGAGFFRLLGHYAPYVRKLLRKREVARQTTQDD